MFHESVENCAALAGGAENVGTTTPTNAARIAPESSARTIRIVAGRISALPAHTAHEVMESVAHLRSNHVPPRSQKDRRNAMRVSQANYLVDVGDNIMPLSRASSMATVKNVSSVTVCGRAATLAAFRRLARVSCDPSPHPYRQRPRHRDRRRRAWAAIAAHQAGAEVVVVGKRPRLDAHTVLASGGINAALGTRDPEDSWQQHFADTLAEGYLLGDPARRRDPGARGAGRGRGAGRVGVPVRPHRGRSHRPAVLRRPPLAAHLLRRRLHGPRHPAHAGGQGRRARASRSSRSSTCRGC